MSNDPLMSPLHQTAMTTATDIWNDSCSIEELKYAIQQGSVGATSNPGIVLNVLKKEMYIWKDRIFQLINENPSWSEDQITWKIFEEIAVKGAEQLVPIFQREKGMKGRLSIQTNPAAYRDPVAILRQALHFSELAENMQVKIPVTRAGIQAIEEATYQGVNINATVCFTVPQALAVGEAVERALKRREADGKKSDEMTPVCTIMIGRLDDWMHAIAKRDGILVKPGTLDWAGIAAIKKAYKIYKSRGYHTRLLAAAYRHHLHWTELIGGDLILTIPYEWQLLFNRSGFLVRERMDNSVPPEALETLYEKFTDFRRAYDEDGLKIDEFDGYGATVRTLRSFIGSYHDLVAVIRDFMLPNPDIKQVE